MDFDSFDDLSIDFDYHSIGFDYHFSFFQFPLALGAYQISRGISVRGVTVSEDAVANSRGHKTQIVRRHPRDGYASIDRRVSKLTRLSQCFGCFTIVGQNGRRFLLQKRL